MPCLKGSGADIIDDGVTEQVVLHLFRRHVFRLLADDDRQLRLIIQVGDDIAMAGNPFPRGHRPVHPFGKIDRVRALAAEGLLLEAGRFLRVGHVVDSQADHVLNRIGDGGQNLHLAPGRGPIDPAILQAGGVL